MGLRLQGLELVHVTVGKRGWLAVARDANRCATNVCSRPDLLGKPYPGAGYMDTCRRIRRAILILIAAKKRMRDVANPSA